MEHHHDQAEAPPRNDLDDPRSPPKKRDRSYNEELLTYHIEALSKEIQVSLDAAVGRQIDEIGATKAALAVTSMEAIFRLSRDKALDGLLECGDFGIAGMIRSSIHGNEFLVHLFLGRTCGREQGDHSARVRVEEAARAATQLLDPQEHTLDSPTRAAERVTALKRLLHAGLTPRVRIYLVSNVSLDWDAEEANRLVERLLPGARIEYFGPDDWSRLRLLPRNVTTSLRLAGASALDQVGWNKLVVGKMLVDDVARLLELQENELLRDAGRFMDSEAERLYENMCRALSSDTERRHFCAHNGGITLGCTSLSYSELVPKDQQIRVEDLRILDGRKTCKAIYDTIVRRGDWQPNGAYVMVRVLEIPESVSTGAFPPRKIPSRPSSEQRPLRETEPWHPGVFYMRAKMMSCAELQIAAAGGHNVLLLSPWTGHSLFVSCLRKLLPPMTQDELLEKTAVYSAAGFVDDCLLDRRPFQAPHYTDIEDTLLAGETKYQPGPVLLAHNGVLFLDNLTDFPRSALCSLQEPLEKRTATIAKKKGTVALPASVLLVALSRPCPCGWLGSGTKSCRCPDSIVESHRAKMTSTVLDAMELQMFLPQDELNASSIRPPYEDPDVVRTRVEKARAQQRTRLKPWGIRTNAEMNEGAIRATCRLDDNGERALAVLRQSDSTLTDHDINRIVRVARTIADLREQESIDNACLLEAAKYRVQVANPAADGPRPLLD